MKVRTRFAPSPTGFLHVGNVRAALFPWLVARQGGGKFVLRIEDTDRAREISGAIDVIKETLGWLGINWDEGPDIGGPYEPYTQTQRLEHYHEWAKKLVDKGAAYADTRTPQELDALRADAKSKNRPFLARDYRPENPPEWEPGMPLRFKSNPKPYRWHDAIMGDLTAGEEAVDDFIMIKSDKMPTYNFAHVVDDHEMEITHVIRGLEYISSMPKYLNLYDALEIRWPIFAHMPHIMAPDGKKKLSKRDGAKSILAYRDDGLLPEAVVNFLASLGWNDGTEQEIFSVDELIKKFSLERVQRSGARFDEQRLIWMNGHYIRELPLEELAKRAEGFWPDSAGGAAGSYKNDVLALVQERLKFLAELPELSGFFFDEPKRDTVLELYKEPVDKQLKKLDLDEMAELLKSAIDSLKASDFSRDDLAERLNNLLTEIDTKPGMLFAAIRIAVTGSASSPELFSTLAVLGKDKTLTRLQKALTELEKAA